LHSLNLSYNSLVGVIPESIGNLTGIGFLHLESNNLSGSLPESIKNLTSFSDLTNNYLVANPSFDSWLNSHHFNGANNFRVRQKIKSASNFRAEDITKNSVTLKWSDNSNKIATYEIYKDNVLLTELPAGTTEYSVESLTSGTAYNFTLKTKYYNTYTMPTDLNISITTKDAQENIQRKALIDLYNATNGDNWRKKRNWLSNKSICEWQGVKCNSNKQVVTLSLGFNNLTGHIPDSIKKLTELSYIFLYGNKLSGSIPNSIGDLTKLTILVLAKNQLSGSIPSSISNLTKMQWLYLQNNKLSGSIPSSIGNLHDLKALYLSQNSLTGEIPKSIGNLSGLMSLNLSSNNLTGEIPSSIGNLTKVDWLFLQNNRLSGSIPNTIGNLTNLYTLKLSNNQLTGAIPQSIGNLSKLEYLYIDNNKLSGALPNSMKNLTKLSRYSYMGNNYLVANSSFNSWLNSHHYGGASYFRSHQKK